MIFSELVLPVKQKQTEIADKRQQTFRVAELRNNL
jgi:hypothetical protein